MADDDDDKGKTLKELIEEQNAFEEEALAKIQENWGNESRCTYHDGSISQPVFSCLTCLDSFGRAVGVCFGCSMACHLDHVIVELFDKRNFRCDCGTGDQKVKCSFEKDHSSRSTLNKNFYNQNFQGLYCWCKQLYDGEVTMFQCFLCQDWFHEMCLKKRISESKMFSSKEFDPLGTSGSCSYICPSCITTKGSFLLSQYQSLLVSPFKYKPVEIAPEEKPSSPHRPVSSEQGNRSSEKEICKRLQPTWVNETTPLQDKRPTEADGDWICNTCESDFSCHSAYRFRCEECEDFDLCFFCWNTQTHQEHQEKIRLVDTHLPDTKKEFQGIFLINNWFAVLCSCPTCKETVSSNRLDYLFETPIFEKKEETTEPTPPPPKSDVSILDAAKEAFLQSDLSQSQKVALIERYQHFQNTFEEYLSELAEKKVQTVTPEHIREFTEERLPKRRRLG